MAYVYKNGQAVGVVYFHKDLQGLLRGLVRNPLGNIQLIVFQVEDLQKRPTEQRSWAVSTPAPEHRIVGRGNTRKNAVLAAGYELR
mgnify:CR=1 FL=1